MFIIHVARSFRKAFIQGLPAFCKTLWRRKIQDKRIKG